MNDIEQIERERERERDKSVYNISLLLIIIFTDYNNNLYWYNMHGRKWRHSV